MNNNQKSFTLMELLIVITVIAILAAIVLVSLNNATQSANEAKGLQFSQNIRTALGDSLVGEWSFDDSNNPGIDDSGNNNNGTLNGQVWTEKGKVRGALQFNANRVNIPYKLSLLPSEFTVEAWVNPTSIGSWTGIITNKVGPADGFNLQVGTVQGVAMLIGDGSSYRYVRTSWIPKTKTWYHILATHRSNNVNQLYVNGKKEVETIFGLAYSGSNPQTCIGCFYLSGPQFIGTIDEVRIYNRALTAYEIQQLYAEGLSQHLANRK